MTWAPPTDAEIGADRADGPLPTVPLPERGDGVRRRRRRRRERRRAAIRVIALFAVATVVPLVVIPAVEEWRTPTSGAAPAPGPDLDAALGAPPPLVLAAVVGEAGLVTGLTVLVPRAEGGGAVLFMPPGAMVEVPSFGLQRLGDAHRLGGDDLLRASAENLFGVRFDAVEVLDAGALAALVGPAGPLTVEVPDRIEAVDAAGRVEIRFERGPTVVSPEQVGELLTAPAAGTDLARLVRHEAFWEAWLAAVAAEARAVPGGEANPGVAAAVGALARGSVSFHVAPVEPMSTGLAEGEDLYRVVADQLAALISQIVPGAPAAASAERLRVQLLNGTGEPGLAQAVTPRLLPAGVEVKLVGNADRFDYTVTQIVYYDPANRGAAVAVADALGVGQVVRSRQRLSVVDLTVVVGRDFLDADGTGDTSTENP